MVLYTRLFLTSVYIYICLPISLTLLYLSNTKIVNKKVLGYSINSILSLNTTSVVTWFWIRTMSVTQSVNKTKLNQRLKYHAVFAPICCIVKRSFNNTYIEELIVQTTTLRIYIIYTSQYWLYIFDIKKRMYLILNSGVGVRVWTWLGFMLQVLYLTY